jgi:hypothetical protein
MSSERKQTSADRAADNQYELGVTDTANSTDDCKGRKPDFRCHAAWALASIKFGSVLSITETLDIALSRLKAGTPNGDGFDLRHLKPYVELTLAKIYHQ